MSKSGAYTTSPPKPPPQVSVSKQAGTRPMHRCGCSLRGEPILSTSRRHSHQATLAVETPPPLLHLFFADAFPKLAPPIDACPAPRLCLARPGCLRFFSSFLIFFFIYFPFSFFPFLICSLLTVSTPSSARSALHLSGPINLDRCFNMRTTP